MKSLWDLPLATEEKPRPTPPKPVQPVMGRLYSLSLTEHVDALWLRIERQEPQS